MALATLSIDLVAKLANLEQGMSKATRIAEKNAAAIEARYRQIGNVVKSVAGVIGTAFAGVSFAQFIRGTADGLEALVNLKEATGASVENISALEDVAARSGIAFEDVSKVLIKFNKILTEAKPGTETANIFKNLGLDAEKLKQADPAEALRQTAVALDRFADSGTKARYVQALFDKSVESGSQLLKDLAGQTELVGKVTTAQAEAAKRFNDQLADLSKNARDAARSLVGELLPALNSYFESLRKNGGFTGSLLARLGLDDLSQQQAKAETFNAAINRTADSIGRMSEELARNPKNELLAGRIDKARERLAGLQKEAAVTSETIKKLANDLAAQGGTGRRPANEGGGKFLGLSLPDIPSATKAGGKGRAEQLTEAQRALAAYVSQLDKERQKIVEISEEQEALNVLKSLGTLGEIPQVRALVLGLAAEVDQRKDLEAITKLQATAEKELAQQREESQRALGQLLDQTPVNQYGKLIDLTAQLDDAFRGGKVTGVQYAQALKLIDEALSNVEPAAKKATDEIDEFTREAARNIQDALGDTVLSSLKGDFNSIGKLWGDLVQRMIAQALAANLGQLLMGDFGKSGKVGGVLGDLFGFFGFAKGGAFGGGLQPFASGGVVGAPTVFKFAGGTGLMGEAGPEAIMPLKRGRDGKLGVSSDGGGITIVNNVAAGVTRNEVYNGLQMVANSLRGEFKQALRAAGVA